MMKYGQIFRLLLNSSEDEPVVLKKADLPHRLGGCDFATLNMVFSTPNNKLCGHETPDTWVLWLRGPA